MHNAEMTGSKFQIGPYAEREQHPHQREESHFVAKILQFFGHHHGLRVLEIGIASGFVSNALKKSRPSWKISKIESFADSTVFEDDSFDLVVSSLSFHKFENPEMVVMETKRVLVSGGAFFAQDFHQSTKWLHPFQFVLDVVSDQSLGVARSKWKALTNSKPRDEMRRLLTSLNFGILEYSLSITSTITETLAVTR